LGRFLTILDLHVQILDIYFIDHVFVEIVRFARSWSLSLLDHRVFLFTFIHAISPISHPIVISFYFIWYHVWTFICVIAVILIYY